MFSSVQDHVASAVKLYRVNLEDLPDYWADDDCDQFRTGLNAGFGQGSSDGYYMWAAYKSVAGEQDDVSENDYGLDDSESGQEEEEEPLPSGSEKVSKRDLVCYALLQPMLQYVSQDYRV